MAHRPGTSGTRKARRPLAASALLIGALAAVTACGSDTGDTGHGAARVSDAPSSEDTGSGTSTDTPSRTASPTGPATAPAAGHSSICAKDELKASVGRVDVGAGNVYAPLVFTNKSDRTCTLTGFPGVSLLGTSGKRIGDPAVRRDDSHPTVTLKPGGSAFASLHTINEGMSDKPCWPRADELRAYPPDSKQSFTVPAHSFRVCGEVFEVAPLEAGTQP